MVRFAYYAGALSWTRGQDTCRTKHTDLASVWNHGDSSEIKKLVNGEKAWIGLFRDSWTWSDGSDTSFRFWLSGKPDNHMGIENCATAGMSQQGHWEDVPCGRRLPFICHGGELPKHESDFDLSARSEKHGASGFRVYSSPLFLF